MWDYHRRTAASWYGKAALFWQREEEFGKAAKGYERALELGEGGGEDRARWMGGLAAVERRLKEGK